MKLPHWVIVVIACLAAAAPFVVHDLPAKYSGIGLAVLAVIGTLKVQALGQSDGPKVPPLPVLLFVASCGAVASAFAPACSASSQQISATVDDSVKLTACVLSVVLSGQTDPMQIGAQCIGAVPALIVQIIDDFEAPHVDAGAASLNVDQAKLLDEAKRRAMVLLAAASRSP